MTMIGTKLAGRYEILAELGRGGMGVVYRAKDPVLNRDVAVKLIPPRNLTKDAEERFQREAQIVAQMDHPSIVPIYDLGRHEGSLFFVMPVLAALIGRSQGRVQTLTVAETRWVVRLAIAVPDILAPSGDAYVLRVRGDSMIEAHIADGDFVVIRPQETARDGDIIVAQVEENAVTLKRFFREKDRVRLQPANPNYPPQFYPSVRIQGKLIGVIRRLD